VPVLRVAAQTGVDGAARPELNRHLSENRVHYSCAITISSELHRAGFLLIRPETDSQHSWANQRRQHVRLPGPTHLGKPILSQVDDAVSFARVRRDTQARATFDRQHVATPSIPRPSRLAPAARPPTVRTVRPAKESRQRICELQRTFNGSHLARLDQHIAT
jgi:hypothetical protein